MLNTSSEEIVRICELYGDMLLQIREKGNAKLTPKQEEEITSISKKILSDIFWHPGALIEFEDENDLAFAKTIFGIIWDAIIDPSEIFDEISDISKLDNMYNLIFDFTDRVKLIKPTFIMNLKIESGVNFKFYFEEAMKAWVYGLGNAAIVLCCSLLEEALEEKLSRFSLDYQNERLINLIEHSRFINVIDDNLYNKMNEIRNVRNEIIHQLRRYSDREILEQINNTKEIIERLYQSK